ncbi:ESX secretion-associated protein EspG [Haloechinothrix sp. LS1_15]|uniref:ESX secretion-associated protein EspG n=1 Tax=Haloechinothrix sp. LS1_15 TaxID=2652248 RepID=UPI0029470DD1|nr:ESX secretion-associated protein EspG [Haloechinothrix sp. LS1_15]MDV6011261.1 ESX secretion-associated protein EspG [Haloechinothrix sp. LS1_15]
MFEEFTLEATAVDVIAEWLGLPRGWQPFDVLPAATTVDERRAYAGEVWRWLRAEGMVDRDRIDADVEAAFRVWAVPEVLVVVRAEQDFDPPHVLYRAAAAGELGVFSEQLGEDIRFQLLKADGLIDHVVGMLPRHQALPVRPHSVVVGGTAPAVGDGDEPELPSLAEQARRYDQRNQEGVRAFARWPVTLCGGYELHLREQDALRHVGTMQFFDTEQGRYLVNDEPLGAGRRRLDFVPSDGSHLRRWLHEEVAFARRGGR